MRGVKLLVLLAGIASACAPGADGPVYSYFPRSLDLGRSQWTNDNFSLRWEQVGVINSSYFPIDVRGVVLEGDGAPFLEARLRGGATSVPLELRESTVVEVRVRPPIGEQLAVWSSSVFEATLRFEVGGSPSTDPNTGLPDPAGYVAEETLVPISFELSCDGDGDGYDHLGCSGGTDCDDTRSAVRPDAVERCDGIDNDCDDVVDGDTCVDNP